MRTPYGKEKLPFYGGTSPNILELLRNGYAVIVQDCKGTSASEGTFVPHLYDAADGADTVRWLVEQEWCDGNIGSFGASYLGFAQWHTASTGAPGLKAIAPGVTSGDLYRSPWYSAGGALSVGMLLGWSTAMSLGELERRRQWGDDDPRRLG
jgi:putative CocE/NonD family hydrolase